MKNLLKTFTVIICIILLYGCKTEKTFPLTQSDILVIYEHGYTKGFLNLEANGHFDQATWAKDSLFIANMWK